MTEQVRVYPPEGSTVVTRLSDGSVVITSLSGPQGIPGEASPAFISLVQDATDSAAAAAASAAQAATLLDTFDDRFLGSFAVAPTLDNDGNALLVGALYYDTVKQSMAVWTGTSWIVTSEQVAEATYQAGIAGGPATAAGASADAAAASAASADADAIAAAASESTATTQAGIATTKAGEAASSASSAEGFSVAAAGSASTASTKASEASSSASTATTQAGIATTQAGVATTQAGLAANSANNAAVSETNAAASAAAAAADSGEYAAARDATKEPMGVVNASAITVSFNQGTRVVTVAPTATSFDYYFAGHKTTVSTSKQVTIDNTPGLHFVYFSDYAGTLVKSMTPWDLGNSVPITAIYWDGTKGLVLEERHGVVMDWATHLRLHSVDGTKVVSGFGVSGYTLSTATDAATTPDVASGVLADEDLRTTVAALTAGANVYKVWYRSGTAGDWTWVDSSVPFTNAASSFIHYNQLTGGSWTRTALADKQATNVYLVAVPNMESVSPGMGFAWILGQAVYTGGTAQADAAAESINSLAFGNLPFTEMAALYRLTFYAENPSANTGKVKLVSMSRIVGSAVSVSQTAVGDHSALSGLTAPNAHPATSISVDTTNFGGTMLTSAEDTVQKALDRLDDVAGTGSGSGGGYKTVFLMGGM